VQVKEFTLRIVPLETALVTIVVAAVLAGAKYATLPSMDVTFTILGFAIFFPYPNTIDIAIALPVVTPPRLASAVPGLAKVTFCELSMDNAVTLAVCKARLPVPSAVVTTAANGVVCAFIVDGIIAQPS
jgi:hypothetical protein